MITAPAAYAVRCRNRVTCRSASLPWDLLTHRCPLPVAATMSAYPKLSVPPLRKKLSRSFAGNGNPKPYTTYCKVLRRSLQNGFRFELLTPEGFDSRCSPIHHKHEIPTCGDDAQAHAARIFSFDQKLPLKDCTSARAAYAARVARPAFLATSSMSDVSAPAATATVIVSFSRLSRSLQGLFGYVNVVLATRCSAMSTVGYTDWGSGITLSSN